MAIGILSSGCQGLDGKSPETTSGFWDYDSTSQDMTDNEDRNLDLGSDYERIVSIKHVTSFEKSKDIFSRRHLAPEENEANIQRRHLVNFEPVMSLTEDDSNERDGNVNFILRSLNGPFGIWNTAGPFTSSLNPLNDDDKLRYYLMSGSALNTTDSLLTEILVTRRECNDLEAYDPLTASGPWRVVWDQKENSFLHFVKKGQVTNNNMPIPSVKFILDDSILGTTDDQKIAFSEHIFVSYSDCPIMGKCKSGLGDNHGTTGPLRLILASACFQWPGGIVLHPSGEFDPERTILRYEAFHARMSRQVMIQREEEEEFTALDQEALHRVEDFLTGIRHATFTEARGIFREQPELISSVRAVLLQLSLHIATKEAYHTLRKVLHAFIVFVACNGLDTEANTYAFTSEESVLQNFEGLYNFVLSFFPDRRCHQIFRDCMVSRIALAVDSK